jgi:hypothetical protein
LGIWTDSEGGKVFLCHRTVIWSKQARFQVSRTKLGGQPVSKGTPGFHLGKGRETAKMLAQTPGGDPAEIRVISRNLFRQYLVMV